MNFIKKILIKILWLGNFYRDSRDWFGDYINDVVEKMLNRKYVYILDNFIFDLKEIIIKRNIDYVVTVNDNYYSNLDGKQIPAIKNNDDKFVYIFTFDKYNDVNVNIDKDDKLLQYIYAIPKEEFARIIRNYIKN